MDAETPAPSDRLEATLDQIKDGVDKLVELETRRDGREQARLDAELEEQRKRQDAELEEERARNAWRREVQGKLLGPVLAGVGVLVTLLNGAAALYFGHR